MSVPDGHRLTAGEEGFSQRKDAWRGRKKKLCYIYGFVGLCPVAEKPGVWNDATELIIIRIINFFIFLTVI